MNSDGSIDGELMVHCNPDTEVGMLVATFAEALPAIVAREQKWWYSFRSLWLRLGAVFTRTEFSEIQTDLPRFRGREQVMVGVKRQVYKAQDQWVVLLNVLTNVLAFGEHSLKAVLVRLHYSPTGKAPEW